MIETNLPAPQADPGVDYSTDVPGQGSDDELPLEVRIEALLFVAPGPVPVSRLARALKATAGKVEQALQTLEDSYQQKLLRIQRHRQGYQLTTAPGSSDDVERFLELERRTTLTSAALEVLAIVAYQQPTTKPFIDSIRGVGSDSPLQTLLRYGLVEEIGRAETPGRPILYASTPYFLQYFGANSMDDLPPIPLNQSDQDPELSPTVEQTKDEGAGT